MTDTPAHVEALYRRLLLQRSGAERLRMGCEMFDVARTLVRAGLGDPSGRDCSGAFKARLFLRVYGGDFDEATAQKIAAHLEARAVRVAAPPRGRP